MQRLNIWMFLLAPCCLLAFSSVQAADPVRVGIVGTDNYQAVAFTQLFHKPPADNPDLPGLQVVAMYPLGSEDLEGSLERVEKWRVRLDKLGVSEEKSIQDVLDKVDAVMIMTLDGRSHLKLAEQVLAAKKPVYIGRPMTASLEDCLAIFALAEKYQTPLFSCSQHRFSPGFIGMRDHENVGKVLGCHVYGGCPTVPKHPHFFGHAIHSFETLYTIMRPGAVSVTCAHTDGVDVVTGVWGDGRIGTYRGIRNGALKYSALVFGDKGIAPAGIYGYAAPVNGVENKGRYKGYEGVSTEIAKFFKTGKLPIELAETIELYTFMEAAHQSETAGGAPVKLQDVLDQAKANLKQRSK